MAVAARGLGYTAARMSDTTSLAERLRSAIRDVPDFPREGVLEIQADAVKPGERVLVVDDLLATGGTAAATASLVEQVGGEVVAVAFLIELSALGGARTLGERRRMALVSF